MKLSSKNELHSIVETLHKALKDEDLFIKKTRLQEIFAKSFEYKSYNGLISSLPIDISITEKNENNFASLLKENHSFDNSAKRQFLAYVEQTHESYSTYWNSDSQCYPKSISKNENYWYLTKEGWKPWSEMDFKAMRVELNIYEVVHSSSNFLGGSARSIWDACIASHEFELEADRLIKQYGQMPAQDILYPKYVE